MLRKRHEARLCLIGLSFIFALGIACPWAFQNVFAQGERAVIPVQTQCDAIPIGALDDTFICKISPDLIDLTTMQEGHTEPLVKITPKKSWELGDNWIGGTTTRLPRSREFDFTPGSAIHLIDNDPLTFWTCNMGESRTLPPWVRVQFAKETTIASIELLPVPPSITTSTSLLPRKAGAGFPRRIEIQSSRDGVNWKTLYTSSEPVTPDDKGRFHIEVGPHRALDVRVIATGLEDSPIWAPGMFSMKCFALAEFSVFDETGRNIALASRGTNIFVSATEYGYPLKRMIQDQLWPSHYDVGYKYLRMAYWDSVLNWHYVEQEKGVYRIDPHVDALITETVQNGIEPVLCLSYSNWLYTPEGQRPNPHTQYEILYEIAPANFGKGSPMLKGYINFVSFMVRHFKGRIKYYEIWNEPDVWGGGMTPEMYAGMVKEVVPVIRKEDPDAKIMLGSIGGEWVPWKDTQGRDRGRHVRIRYDYLKEVLRQGVAPLIDIIGWHPFYSTVPDDPFYRNYPQEVSALKASAEGLGFKGRYMATEFTYWARPGIPGQPWSGMGENVTKLVKAKYAARVLAMHAGMGIPAFWNETFEFTFRPTSNGGLQGPYQPEPIYYVLRTLCTILDGVKPALIPVIITGKEPLPHKVIDGVPYYARPENKTSQPLMHYTFRLPDGGVMVALWYDGLGSDDFAPIVVDCKIAKVAKKVTAIDTMNGVAQILKSEMNQQDTLIRGLKIADYPIFLKLQ